MSAATDALFALVDVNNCYVSCERSFNPKLIGRPVVVLSNNDGCAVARSNEVKALGVKMGTPWFQMKDLARKHGIIALSSNYVLYGDMSNRIMTILRDYSPEIEVYSIDESFLNLTGLDGLWESRTAMGQAMRMKILRWTALPVCVGIAPTKTLAKLANHIAKKAPRFDGVCDLTAICRREREELFSTINVGEVWGVGGRIGKRLVAAGIDTVQALRMTSPTWLRAEFGVVMERTVNELRGISCLDLEEIPSPKKQIVTSKSFGQMVTTIDELAAAASTYMTRAAEKLRAQNSVAGAVNVFVMTNRFRESDPQYSNGMTVPLPDPSNDTRVLTAAALHGLERIYRENYAYKKVGVMLLDISSAANRQGSLFDCGVESSAASKVIMAAMDGVNARFGRDTLFLASKGTAARWANKSENRTPRYTTNWDELPKVRAG